MSLPTQHRALIVKDGNPTELIVTEKALPLVREDEILVKVMAVTLNPTDFKHVWNYGLLKPGDSLGCDFAGEVVYVGPSAGDKFRVGDGAAGFIRGGMHDNANGTFQEYVKATPEMAWKIPTDILEYEDAASMGGIALSTAVLGLHRLGLPTPWEPAKESIPILIWAGATSVGIYAIRLAKISGLRVATTASLKNHAFLKELGAEVVFDYRDPEAPRKIKEWSQGEITHGFDTISEDGSPALAAAAFSDQGGRLITLLPVAKFGGPIALVEPERLYVYDVLAPENSSVHQSMSLWYNKVPEFAAQLKVMPLIRWDGGLDAIPAALSYLREGRTSAQKIAVRI